MDLSSITATLVRQDHLLSYSDKKHTYVAMPIEPIKNLYLSICITQDSDCNGIKITNQHLLEQLDELPFAADESWFLMQSEFEIVDEQGVPDFVNELKPIPQAEQLAPIIRDLIDEIDVFPTFKLHQNLRSALTVGIALGFNLRPRDDSIHVLDELPESITHVHLTDTHFDYGNFIFTVFNRYNSSRNLLEYLTRSKYTIDTIWSSEMNDPTQAKTYTIITVLNALLDHHIELTDDVVSLIDDLIKPHLPNRDDIYKTDSNETIVFTDIELPNNIRINCIGIKEPPKHLAFIEYLNVKYLSGYYKFGNVIIQPVLANDIANKAIENLGIRLNDQVLHADTETDLIDLPILCYKNNELISNVK